MTSSLDDADDRFGHTADRRDAARFLRDLPCAVLLGLTGRHRLQDAVIAAAIDALVTARFGEPASTGSPMTPVVDPDVIEALVDLDIWHAASDARAAITVTAYDVAADVDVRGVRIPAGLYTLDTSPDGRTNGGYRWTDRDAVRRHLARIAARHTARRADIDRYAHAVLTLITADERPDGPLHDAAVRSWQDLHRYVDANEYLHDVHLPWGTDIADHNPTGQHLANAVQARADDLLRDRDRPLTVEEARAAGLDDHGGDPPTWGSLTPRQRAALHLR